MQTLVKSTLMKIKQNQICLGTFMTFCVAMPFCLFCIIIVQKRQIENKRRLSSTFAEIVSPRIESIANDSNIREIQWKVIVKELKTQKKTKNLPKIIGIGMEDCGIDDLINLLHPHPSVRIHFTPGSNSFENLNAVHFEKYLDSLPLVEEKAYLLEKKSLSFHLPPYNIPYFLKKLFPTTKLLLVVCEPAQRAYDNFNQEKFDWKRKDNPSINEYESFDDFIRVYLPFVKHEIGEYNIHWRDIEAENKLFDLLNLQKRHYLTSILTSSLYALHLKRWLNHFGKNDLMVIDRHELHNDPGLLVEKVQEFALLPKLLLKSDFLFDSKSNSWCFDNKHLSKNTTCFRRYNSTSFLSTVRNTTVHHLKLLYKSHNEKLFKILGKNFTW